MATIVDMRMMMAAAPLTGEAWDIVKHRQGEASKTYQSSILAEQKGGDWLTSALNPIFGALTSIGTTCIQNVMAGQKFFNPGTLFNPTQQPGPFVGPPAPSPMLPLGHGVIAPPPAQIGDPPLYQ